MNAYAMHTLVWLNDFLTVTALSYIILLTNKTSVKWQLIKKSTYTNSRDVIEMHCSIINIKFLDTELCTPAEGIQCRPEFETS